MLSALEALKVRSSIVNHEHMYVSVFSLTGACQHEPTPSSLSVGNPCRPQDARLNPFSASFFFPHYFQVATLISSTFFPAKRG